MPDTPAASDSTPAQFANGSGLFADVLAPRTDPVLATLDSTSAPYTKTFAVYTTTEAREGQCRLPELDPWGSDVRSHLDPSYDPFKGCTPTLIPRTRVHKGRIEMNGEYRNHSCEFRCNYPLNDWNITFGAWLNVSHAPDCDVFEVRCKDASGKLDYTFLHAQIYRNESQKRPPTVAAQRKEAAENDLPDVYLLVLDSVSTPQVLRSWPKTMHVLREEFGAVLFPFVNKVGDGSIDNGYAMLLGKQTYSIPARAGHDAMPAEDPSKELCRRAMDNESFIGYEFIRRGYASMMCEDWYTAMSYPDCVGFRKPPTDHYFVPFALRYDWSKEGKEDRTLYNNLEKNTCTPQYKYSMDYLRDFIDAYPDRPKWTMTWIVTLAHNNGNALYPTDDVFASFFRQYKSKMRNAFLFVVGDHGLRHTALRQTTQGALEDKNPVSIVVVPERLRKNEHLMSNLRKNSQQLTTHYDLYATLQNIAREGRKMTVDTLFDRLDTRGWDVTLHGESYLYPFNTTITRNCVSQRVPEEYCLCQSRQVNRTKEKQPLAMRAARFLVDRMNSGLEKEGASTACASLSLHPDNLVELLETDDTTYRIKYSTLPGGGRFSTTVKVLFEDNNGGTERFDLEERKIARLDSYEEQAQCTRTYSVRPYCYCRNLASSTSKPA